MSDEPKKTDRKRLGRSLALCWGAVVVLAAYFGAYYATTTPMLVSFAMPSGGVHMTRYCGYAVGRRLLPDAVTVIFWPAHQIDRIVRPETWSERR
jgi:hypothetical protein